MSNQEDTDIANSDPKPPTSKRTLAIIYALVVLAFAVGLVITDTHKVQSAPVQPVVNDLSSR